jgi:hypothetical protein
MKVLYPIHDSVVDPKRLLEPLPRKTIIDWKGAIFGPAPPLPTVGQVPALGHLVALGVQHQAGRPLGNCGLARAWHLGKTAQPSRCIASLYLDVCQWDLT